MSRSSEELLNEALVHFDAAASYLNSDIQDAGLVTDAMSMRLYAGLEVLTHLPSTTTDRLFGSQWADMRGLRNRIAHGYGGLDLTRLRTTVEVEMAVAVESLRRELGHH